ncbi:MAG: hypothetical protein PVH18_04480, partial [Chloroflexota bacterium]
RLQRFVYEDNLFRDDGGEDFIPRLWATRAIGNLLTQIRLHGEDSELVQSVIDLSIRYGIITPYTSYLIEEDDIFSQTRRDMIAEEAMESLVEVTRVVSGEGAVDMAADEAEMAAAEAPVAPSLAEPIITDNGSVRSADDLVQIVGGKTFVMRDGTWVDTIFDADRQTPEQVGFASDSYFELLSAAPELGQYLALGPSVLVVHDGVAYQVVEGAGSSQITLPANAQPQDNPIDELDATSPAASLENNQSDPTTAETNPTEPPETDETVEGQGGLCASLLIAPLALIGLVLATGKRRRSEPR